MMKARISMPYSPPGFVLPVGSSIVRKNTKTKTPKAAPMKGRAMYQPGVL
jgi:hypothetical protein